jgi:nucleoside-diphosphate-sugar epimerase
VLKGLQGRVAMQFCSLRLTAIYGPGRRTESPFTAMIAAARAGRPLPVPAQTTSQPYVFIDDAADAAIAACLAPTLTQLFYNIAHPEMVSLQDIAAALAACGHPVELQPDPALPIVPRGSLAVAAATRDFDFTARIDHHGGIRRMLAV